MHRTYRTMRERYIDIVKGFAILCIVLLHFINGIFPMEFHTFVGSFMITSFYVCSGWLSAQKPNTASLREFSKKRFKQIGIPYFYWSVIILLFDCILWAIGYYDSSYISKEVYKTIVLRGCGTLWFLPAMFFGGIIWHYLRNKNRYHIIVFLIVTIVYRVIYDYIFTNPTTALENTQIIQIINAPLRVILNILEAGVGIAFGYFAFKLSQSIFDRRKLLFLLSVLLLLTAFYFANFYPLKIQFVWHYLAPLIGPLGWIYFYKSLQNLSIWNYFVFWGKNSLCLMVTHYSITLVVLKYILMEFSHIPLEGWISFVAFFISLPIQHVMLILIDKYAPKTLGK